MPKLQVPRYPELLHVRCPEILPSLIEKAAKAQFMTPAEYIRRAIFERLKRDGIEMRKT